MGDSDPTPSCLSAEKNDARDSTMHYLGCREFWKREEYFESLKPEDRKRINGELRRIIGLRRALKNESDDSVSSLRLANGVSQEFHQEEKAPGPYDPDNDVKAYLVSYKDRKHVDSTQDHGSKGHFHDHKMIAFQRKILVSQLLIQPAPGGPLKASDRLLSELSQASAESINYLHLPANNMARAVELYFGDEGHDHSHGEKTKAQMLLGPQFWRDQQHGGKSSEIHARHLRSLCEMVPSDPAEVDATLGNTVLFMPYLHWKTNRQRENITRFLDQEEEKHRKSRETAELGRKQNRQLERRELPRALAKQEEIAPPKISRTKDLRWIGPHSLGIYKTLTQVASAVQPRPQLRRSRHLPLFKNDKNGRVLANRNKPAGPLGEVLIDAARLYEAIATYRDKMLIRKTLKTTKARDRDQVVYRGTRPDPPHSIDMKTREWTCFDEGTDDKDVHTENTQAQIPERKGQFCVHCANHVRKVSRILMVDQLWMWILDDKTIITALPKRYGLNKQDSSGVHKSIRIRLQNLRPGHIKTVYDLALIILDELTNVFFDRTKTAAEQPEALNIFSETIGTISLSTWQNNRQTLGYQHLWDWTRNLAKVASPGALATDLSEFVAPLLNISTESALQREIKYVLDELSIMLYLQNH
ncbi:hypothetical protein LA080_002784 [Diaporthe eres]|nr:hypothetical protein LA080_002784 [Diaporthe eres]